MKAECAICPRRCLLESGQTGFCGARKNTGGAITCENYGQITSMALDPIEKKPLRHFYPGSFILSVGSCGCNMRCPFCQNHRISTPAEKPDAVYVSPEALVEKAESLKSRGNIGIAYTYNEPLIGYEYVTDCARLAQKKGLKNVLVTNGFINEGPLSALLPFIDAANIDLKCFNDEYYRKLGGGLDAVKRTIETAAQSIHVEVTTLIIPGENDSEGEMDMLSAWLSAINSDIPLHVSRFFPNYKYADKAPAPVEHIYSLAGTARKNLRRVYTGNC